MSYLMEGKARNSSSSGNSKSLVSSPGTSSFSPSQTTNTSKFSADKLKLFSSNGSNLSPTVDKPSRNSNTTTSTTSATMSTMNEVAQRLHDRGEKLSKMSDRSAQLADNASEFSRLAKQLKEQQKNSWF